MNKELPKVTPKGYCVMCKEKIKWDCDYRDEGCKCVSPKDLCEKCEASIWK